MEFSTFFIFKGFFENMDFENRKFSIFLKKDQKVKKNQKIQKCIIFLIFVFFSKKKTDPRLAT